MDASSHFGSSECVGHVVVEHGPDSNFVLGLKVVIDAVVVVSSLLLFCCVLLLSSLDGFTIMSVIE